MSGENATRKMRRYSRDSVLTFMAGDGILCICMGWRWNWNAMVPIGGVDDDNASTDKGAKRERATKGAKHSYGGIMQRSGKIYWERPNSTRVPCVTIVVGPQWLKMDR